MRENQRNLSMPVSSESFQRFGGLMSPMEML
jgi:hypothetical protein